MLNLERKCKRLSCRKEPEFDLFDKTKLVFYDQYILWIVLSAVPEVFNSRKNFKRLFIIDVVILRSRTKLMGKEATSFKTFSFMTFNGASIATLEKSTTLRQLLMRSIIVKNC